MSITRSLLTALVTLVIWAFLSQLHFPAWSLYYGTGEIREPDYLTVSALIFISTFVVVSVLDFLLWEKELVEALSLNAYTDQFAGIAVGLMCAWGYIHFSLHTPTTLDLIMKCGSPIIVAVFAGSFLMHRLLPE